MTEPTGPQKLKYYTLGLTPPAVSREWVERDVGSTGFLIRRASVLVASLVIGFSISTALLGGNWWTVVGGLIGGLIASSLQMTFFADHVRRRTLSYYRKKWDRQPAI